MIPLRLMLAGGAAVAVLGLAGGAVWKIKHDEAVKWQARVHAAEQQAAVRTVETQAVDHYHEQTVVIREKADHAEQAVRQAPGAASVIDPDRRAIVCAELERVRDAPVCADPDGAGDAPQAMRGPDKPAAHPGR